MSDFYVGQDVVCVKNYPEAGLIKDSLHVAKGLKDGICNCVKLLIDVGIRVSGGIIACQNCNTISNSEPDNIWWIASEYFKPLDELTDISELTEVLEEELVI